ncbi:MAG: hypothetical protein KJ645_02860 [Planctomycetes bacterium]|nr:hypothetical protein [Planctomycetota bacterium]
MDRSTMNTMYHRLERQRIRLKRIYLIHGVLHLLLRFCLSVGVLFLLDYALDLPRGARITLVIMGLVYLGYTGYRWLLYPLSRPFTRKDMALALERKFDTLDGSLVSALEFQGADTGRPASVSPRLVEASLVWAEKKAEQIDWAAVFDLKGVKKLAGFTAAVFVLLAGLALIQPTLARIWTVRAMGGSTPWPRATTLLIELEGTGESFKLLAPPDPRSRQEVLISRGTSLPIRIQVEGRDPGEVRVVYETDSTQPVRAVANRRGVAEYWYRFRNVRETMRFWVEGGDDHGRDRSVEVSVIVPPQVVSVRAEYRYPEYLNLEPEVRDTAQIEGPEGTEVALTFTLSKPAASASLSLRNSRGTSTIPLELGEGDDPVLLRHEFALDESGTYQVLLVGEEGFSNGAAPFNPILVRKDDEPRVKLYAPRRKSSDIGPRGLVVFRAKAVDDYGVASMRLKYKYAGEETWETHDFAEAEIDAPFGSKEIGAGHLIDFDLAQVTVEGEQRKMDRGDVLLYVVEATDYRPDHEPGVAGAGGYVINVVSENEKIRILTELQIRLKEEVRGLRTQQADRLEKTTAFLEMAGEDDWGEQDLISLEIGQNRMTSRYQSVTRELAEIFDGYLFNRIDKTQAASAFLYRAAYLHLAAEMKESFDPRLYIEVLDIFRSGTLGEMSLMERLAILLGLSLNLSESLSPDAGGLMARAVVATDREAAIGLISDSEERQKEILSTLDQLLVKMDEWEDYQELLQLFRDVIDSQHNVNILMREELRKRK